MGDTKETAIKIDPGVTLNSALQDSNDMIGTHGKTEQERTGAAFLCVTHPKIVIKWHNKTTSLVIYW
ncbi:hypothetical protein M5W98_17765 [Paenibacillus apiarius]|nr:hypothetical protein [Paenibacillus apiarius]